ncbi:hypothetical protein GCM10027519_19650 [Kineococcus endophyticus]
MAPAPSAAPTAAAQPVTPVDPAPAAQGTRELLSASVELPVDLPSNLPGSLPGHLPLTGSVSVQLPLPDPVTVTGEVSAPAPGEVRVEVRVETPAAPASQEQSLGSVVDRAARHLAGPSGS